MQCHQCGKESAGDLCQSCGVTIEGSPKWYAEGIALLTQDKQYSIAHDLLEEGLQHHPRSAMLWFNGGVLEELMGDRNAAVRCYQEVLKIKPSAEKPRQALERLLGRPLTPPAPARPAPTPVAPAPETSAPAVAVMAEEPSLAEPIPVSEPAPLPVQESAPVAVASSDAVIPHDEIVLPPLPEVTPSVPQGSAIWRLVARVCGVLFPLSFVALVVLLILADKMGQIGGVLFLVDLVLFIAAATMYFVGKALSYESSKRIH